MADDTTASLGEQMKAAETEAKPYEGTSDTDAPDTAADDELAAGGTDPDLHPADTDSADGGEGRNGQIPGGALPAVGVAGALRCG